MNIAGRKQQQIKDINQLLEKNEITQELHDKAIKLSQGYFPWIWKRNSSGKIVGIVDIFQKMQDDKKGKRKRKS
jgi:hypothetical protein